MNKTAAGMRSPDFIKFVLFDMDGVIADSMKNHAAAWIAVLGEKGLSLSEHDILKREGMSGEASVMDIFNEKGVELPSRGEFRAMMEKKHDIFERMTPRIYPGAREILVFLKGRGIRLALVTGSLYRTVNHMIPGDIIGCFDAVVSSEKVERGKPDPEPYLKAIEHLGADPEFSVAVENAPMGILSAKRAGLYCIAVETTLDKNHLDGADLVLSNHGEILQYFMNFLKM
ncbi:MAG: HAD family phosphatase [Spirochaetes bacterium]|jgi:beta-phosphoglucomutase|nr:HAD family phosphatase [Spirochaetota bacterium]